MEQELLTLPEHLSSHPVFSGIRVTRSLLLCVCFIDRWPLCCVFFFDIRLPLWHLQSPQNLSVKPMPQFMSFPCHKLSVIYMPQFICHTYANSTINPIFFFCYRLQNIFISISSNAYIKKCVRFETGRVYFDKLRIFY